MGPSGARRADLLGSMASRCAPVSQAAPHDFEVVPIAVFAIGPRSGDEAGWQRSRAQLDRALAKRGWLAYVAVAVFTRSRPTEGTTWGATRPPRLGGDSRLGDRVACVCRPARLIDS